MIWGTLASVSYRPSLTWVRHGSIRVKTWTIPCEVARPEHHIPVGKKVHLTVYDVFRDKHPNQPYGLQGNTHLIAEKGEIAERMPIFVKLKKGEVYLWCMCGFGNMQPFCDGNCNRPEGSGPVTKLKPVAYVPDKDMDAWLCACKQTSNRPFCDGSHKHLPPPKPIEELKAPIKAKKLKK